MSSLTLKRIVMNKDITLGILSEGGYHICFTIENPWLNNERIISCIPSGIYTVRRKDSPKFGSNMLTIDNVKDRDHCLFHSGNRVEDTQGCILPNDSFSFGSMSGYGSKTAMSLISDLYPLGFELEILEYV